MKTFNVTIETLTSQVNNAHTHTSDGRQSVANACKQLYNLIENDVVNAGSEWMLQGMYNDLCNGNFADGFLCEIKKSTFETIVLMYNTRILPRL